MEKVLDHFSFLMIDCSTAFSKVNEYIVYMSRLHVNLYILENTKNVQFTQVLSNVS